MIIETAKGKFWIDDSAVTEDQATGELKVDFSKRVKYERYLITSQIDELKAQNQSLLDQTPNAVLLDWAKQNHPARQTVASNLVLIDQLQAQLVSLKSA